MVTAFETLEIAQACFLQIKPYKMTRIKHSLLVTGMLAWVLIV